MFTISLVTIHPNTKLLLWYWPYSLCCTLHPLGWRFAAFNPLHLYGPLPYSNLSGNYPFVLSIYESVSVFILLVFSFHYKWNHMKLVFLCLTISLSIIPFRSIHIFTNGKHLFFNGWVRIHYVCYVCMCACLCVCIPHLLYPFFLWGTLRLLLYLGYCKRKKMLHWTLECMYVFELIFLFPLSKYLEVKLLDHTTVLVWIFWGTSILFPIVTALVYNPTNNVQWTMYCSFFSTSLVTLVWYLFDRCEVASHCGFDLHFPDD